MSMFYFDACAIINTKFYCTEFLIILFNTDKISTSIFHILHFAIISGSQLMGTGEFYEQGYQDIYRSLYLGLYTYVTTETSEY